MAGLKRAMIGLLTVGVGAAWLGSGLGACAPKDTVKAPAVPARDALEAHTYPQVAMSPELAGWMAVDRPIVTRGEAAGAAVDPDRPLHVVVPVRTLTDRETIRVQYRFQFFDGKGRPLAPQPDWEYRRMASRTQQFFEANAMDARATDWRLELRAAR